MPVSSSATIPGLLDRMTSTDKDFRFMATNDLMNELQKDSICFDEDIETKATHQIVNLLLDKHGEVQNLAVKCLGFLVARVKDDRRQIVVRSLCQMLKNENEQVRDIASIALKTIVVEIPLSSRVVEIINKDLTPNLLAAIRNHSDVNLQLESLDILTDIITRVGSELSSHHKSMQEQLFSQVFSHPERSAVRKRLMTALSYLSACCSDELFSTTLNDLSLSLKNLARDQIGHTSPVAATTTRMTLQCLAPVIRLAGHRTDLEQINQIVPSVGQLCVCDDDEIREYCIQIFEAFIRRCPENIAPSLPEIIKICLENLTHDPNYNYEEDEEANMEIGSCEDYGSESGEDYSDDDDLSWKVRRASAKCLESIILVRKDILEYFVTTVAPILVSRFKEREDTVKSDIIHTFVSMLRQIRATVAETKYLENPPIINHLSSMIPSIVKKSAHLLREKSLKTRQIVFQLYIEIIHLVPNSLSSYMPSLIPGVIHSLRDKNSSSNMKIDALNFLNELIKAHEPTTFHPFIEEMTPAIIEAVDEQFYKISAEALGLLTQVISIIRPNCREPYSNSEPIVKIIYDKTIVRMSKPDIDLEVKERAIECAGQIISTFGDRMPNELSVTLNMIHDKVQVEATRLVSVKALIRVASSDLNIPLDSIFPEAFATLASFLRKNSRPIKISTLILIEIIVRKNPKLLDSVASVIPTNLSLVNESDLYISQLALTMLTTIIRLYRPVESLTPVVKANIPLNLISSPLLQGAALQATIQFFTTVVQISVPGFSHESMVQILLDPIYNGHSIHKHTYSSTAKAIAAITIHDDSLAFSTVQRLLETRSEFDKNDNAYTIVLMSIGEIGRVKNLSSINGLVEVILQAFNSSSEDVKSAGSYALGCVAIGSTEKFLPIILQEIEARTKRQYLILHSLRELISVGKLDHLEPIWNLLMRHCECHEEGTRNVVSECLGKLTLLEPAELLQRLMTYLKVDYADKHRARSTIVAAIKFTISDQPSDVDALLRQYIGEFLMSLQDTNIDVRRVALITLNSVLHNKPSLIHGVLPKLIPLLYNETMIKKELIREVEMGPFKHEVDDGLDIRKAAFECMYTLLDSCQSRLEIFDFLQHVESGLKDHYDIKMLTYLMLNRLASLCPSAVLQRMDRLIQPIEEVCRSKPKDTAVKQEHERQGELKRSALRAFDSLKAIPNADRHPTLVKFETYVKSEKELWTLYSSIHREGATGSQKINASSGVYNDVMDTS